MISNTTTLTKKDYQNLEKYRPFSAKNLMYQLIMLACGGYLISLTVPFFHNALTGDLFLRVFMIIISIILLAPALMLIFLGIFFKRILTYVAYKRAKSTATRIYNFTDEGIEVFVKSELIEHQELYKYESMTVYHEMSNALCIISKIENRKFFLLIHNDGYTSGSKEEAVALLASKGVTLE